MARMPDIEAEIRRDWERLRGTALHITHASQTPAGMPVNVETTTTTGEHMSAISDKLHSIATTLEPVAEEDLGKLAAVMTNPETAQILGVLHQLSGIGLPAGVIAEVATGLGTLLKIYAPQAAA